MGKVQTELQQRRVRQPMRIVEAHEPNDPPRMLRLRAVRGGEVLGQLTATELRPEVWYLSTLYSNVRRQRVGSALMGEFVRRIGDEAHVHAYAHPQAVGLNRRFGFVAPRDQLNEFGQLLMVRPPRHAAGHD